MDGSATKKKSKGVINTIFIIVCIMTVASWGVSVFNVYFASGAFLDDSATIPHWEPYLVEKALFQAHGYSLAWMDFPLLAAMRESAGAMFDIWDIALMRTYGLFKTAPYFVLVALAGVLEGWVAHNEKVENMAIVSSTRFHLFKKIWSILIVLTMIYPFMPLGQEIPYIGEFPQYSQLEVFGTAYDIWWSDPMNIFALLGLPVMLCAYQVASNFAARAI